MVAAMWDHGDGKMNLYRVMRAFFVTGCFVITVGLAGAAERQVNVDLEALQRHAEAGDRVAQYNIGVLHQTGQFGAKADATEAVRWYRKSATQGYSNAQYNLGVMYLRGEGVERNPKAAINWLRLAAEQQNPAAREALKKLGVASSPSPGNTAADGAGR